MGQKIEVTTYDDWDKAGGVETTAGVESHVITLDGKTYHIDLTDEHWRQAVSPLLAHARTSKPRPRNASSRARSKKIRQWAQGNPDKLGPGVRPPEPLGRISSLVVAAYDANH